MSITWTDWPSDPTYSSSGYWDWRPPWVIPSRPVSINWAAKCTVQPTIEPAALADIKLNLKQDIADDDLLITALIKSAREYIEIRTMLALLTQTWVLQLDRFPRTDRVELWPAPASPTGCILLPRRPVQSVTGITWTDQQGNVNTVDSTTYTVDLISKPARIVLKANATWPNVSPNATASLQAAAGIAVTFVAGYTTTALVPANILVALRLMVGHWYLNREEVLSGTRLVAIQLPVAAEALIGYHTPAMVG
jgi:uncharacterized phiE125 gp8 family phage protein